jgi:pimeloyl-ACP methyl ester carboxylesterase
MARSREEERRAKTRKRLTKGLIFGAAAFGLPALYNAWVARRTARLALAPWSPARTASTSLGQVAYRLLGEQLDGPVVVLLHSLAPGHSSSHWQAVAQRLATNHRVLLLDWPGWGDSERSDRTYSPAAFAQCLGELLQEVATPPFSLVAAGLASAPAVRWANRYPELVQSLVLICPRGGEGPRLAPRDRVIRQLLRLPVLGTSAVHLATSRRSLETQLVAAFADPHRIPEELLDEHEKLSHLPGSRYPLTAYLTGEFNDDIRSLWSRLPVTDVHLIWGRQAESPALVEADLWLQRHHASLNVLEGAGSLPHLERPLEVARLLDELVG